ncbi:MAG: class I SAM-dependent methyltransferase [Acidobacteriota bacterium]|nr:class I SAM-dependent methyltransferase [Acidobacteriota bacterium]
MGAFLQSLPVLIMKPDDLVEFSRQSYAKPESIESWVEDSLVDSGLTTEEREILETFLPSRSGNLLLLGVGGGREAIPLAQMGFQVTGVDYVAAMVDRARENAARRGVRMEGLVQEVSRLDVRESAYDIVWLSRAMYSCVPTRTRRVAMVRRIARALKPGGLLICQFSFRPGPPQPSRGGSGRRIIAASGLGNPAYESGDTLWLNVEFLHEFGSENAVRSELEQGGLFVEQLRTGQPGNRGSAVCRKRPETGQTSIMKKESER